MQRDAQGVAHAMADTHKLLAPKSRRGPLAIHHIGARSAGLMFEGENFAHCRTGREGAPGTGRHRPTHVLAARSLPHRKSEGTGGAFDYVARTRFRHRAPEPAHMKTAQGEYALALLRPARNCVHLIGRRQLRSPSRRLDGYAAGVMPSRRRAEQALSGFAHHCFSFAHPSASRWAGKISGGNTGVFLNFACRTFADASADGRSGPDKRGKPAGCRATTGPRAGRPGRRRPASRQSRRPPRRPRRPGPPTETRFTLLPG